MQDEVSNLPADAPAPCVTKSLPANVLIMNKWAFSYQKRISTIFIISAL